MLEDGHVLVRRGAVSILVLSTVAGLLKHLVARRWFRFAASAGLFAKTRCVTV